jgi:hypothetical protein
MVMKRMLLSVVIMSLLLSSSLVWAQYEEEPYVEGYVGLNYVFPMGYIANDLEPDSINAKSGVGWDFGFGYYATPKLVVGLHFNNRNMSADKIDLNHRVIEIGAYGKYFMRNMTETSLSPYFRLTGGVSFNRLVTPVLGQEGPSYRELTYEPTWGVGIGLGLQYKTNEFGGIFFEAIYNYDFTDGIEEEYRDINYTWGGNNQYVTLKLGVVYNIGPKD